MSQISLPGPADEESAIPNADDESQHHQNNESHQRRQQAPIPDLETCLRAIGQLPGLVALRLLTPAQANAIRASYREILQHHQQSVNRSSQNGISDASLLDLARQRPEIVSMLEPLLTDDQIDLVMKAREGDG